MISIKATDATGFTNSNTSYYYSHRTGKLRKSFLKTLISVYTAKKMVLGWEIPKNIMKSNM